MGTTGLYRKPDDVKAFMDDLYSGKDSNGAVRRVLRSAIVNRIEYYAAVERVEPDGTRIVWAGVAKLGYGLKHEDCKFYYKDMDETVGPYFHNCPAAILDLLTEPHPGYAADWRAKCRQRLAIRENNRKLKAGARFTLPEPLRFGDGVERRAFEAVRWFGKTLRYRCVDTGVVCNITRIRDRALTFIEA